MTAATEITADSEQRVPVAPMLGQMLVSAGKLSERDLERALVAQREMGGLLGEVLVRLGLVAEMDVVTALCEQLDLKFVPKEAYPEEPVTVESLQEHFLLGNQIVPIAADEQSITLAAVKPQDPFIAKALHHGGADAAHTIKAAQSAAFPGFRQRTQQPPLQ